MKQKIEPRNHRGETIEEWSSRFNREIDAETKFAFVFAAACLLFMFISSLFHF